MPPIKPSEIVKAQNIPEDVFTIFNELIVNNFNGNDSTVYQEEVVDALVEKGHNRDVIFNKGWLNVEEAYRKAGWAVEYDKPAYNETGRAYFTFKKKSKK